jgi:hypothetical protein
MVQIQPLDSLRGQALLNDAAHDKGTAFTAAERAAKKGCCHTPWKGSIDRSSAGHRECRRLIHQHSVMSLLASLY